MLIKKINKSKINELKCINFNLKRIEKTFPLSKHINISNFEKSIKILLFFYLNLNIF